MKIKISSRLKNQQGSIILPVVYFMVFFIFALAIVFDLGHLHSVRRELHNAAEAGALAGARALMKMPGDLLTKVYPDCTRGGQAALVAAALNQTEYDKDVIVLPADATLIRWDWQQNQISPFTPSCSLNPATGVNGITVTTRRDSSVGAGSVLLTFGSIFGMTTMDVGVSATAAFGFASSLAPGPFNNIAINRAKLDEWMRDPDKDKFLYMAPDGGDNAAWAAGDGKTPSDSEMVNWINNGSPGVSQTDGVNLNNGEMANLFKYINANAQPGSPNYNNDLKGWLVVLPVVETTKMTGGQPIITFQPIIITSADKKTGIAFKLYDGNVNMPGNPGGTPSQVFTLPKLVL